MTCTRAWVLLPSGWRLTEAALCGWDPITPLNPHLGDGHRVLVAKHHGAVD